MGRHSNIDVQQAFEEFADSDTSAKCAKVRCVHCGFVRAKNTTRQVEHLQECTAYLNSDECREALQSMPESTMNNAVNQSPAMNNSPAQPNSTPGQKNFLMGTRPNPNLQVNRRGPNKRTLFPPNDAPPKVVRPVGRPPRSSMAPPAAPVTPAPAPSLASYLLTRDPASFNNATQQPFLSHAGCGTLSAGALGHWLAQDSHISRGYISFVGQLIGKIKLPAVQNTQSNPLYRTMDLLISALNNVRREMSFMEVTATKFNLQLLPENPNPITKAYLDLFIASAAPCASILEGMVVLWATQHCYRSSWTYASTFSSSFGNQPMLPSFSAHSDTAALNQALIPSWTSPAYAKFVDACRAIVDELANAQTSGNGREEMTRCEGAWKQVLWLWEKSWPEVDGMGEEDESAADARFGSGVRARGGAGGARASTGVSERDAEAADDEDDVVEGGRRESGALVGDNYVSPYGGSGLQAVEAANHV